MKIGIVNDMPVIAEAIRRAVTQGDAHEVIWVAHSGAAAVELCRTRKPDLLLLDLVMPGMDGVETTRQIMQNTPCPILLVTASVDSNVGLAFQALGLGALDAVDTPQLLGDNAQLKVDRLLKKIGEIGRIIGAKPTKSSPAAASSNASSPSPGASLSSPGLVVMGASAGGPAALSAVLSGLPRDFNAAVLVVQHIDAEFVDHLVSWLASKSELPVRLAREGDSLLPGRVLFAGSEGHLVLKARNRVGHVTDLRKMLYCPSVDMLFDSVCAEYSGRAAAVLLTGMGSDGALGLKHMQEKGFYTLAQDQATSSVFGMPKAAAKLKAAQSILPLDQIAPSLVRMFGTHQDPRPTALETPHVRN